MTTSQDAEHIYLEVVHLHNGPPLPPAKSKLCESISLPTKGSEPPKRCCSSLNLILSLMVMILSVLCCVFVVLYINEKAQNCDDVQMPQVETKSSAKDSKLHCEVIRSELAKKKFNYETKCSANECTKVSILFHRRNASDYVISRGAPRMDALTACYWAKPNNTSGNYYVSYVEPDGEDVRIAEQESGERLQKRVWHSFCWTWSSLNGQYKSYENGRIIDVGDFKLGKPLAAGGTWLLGRNVDAFEDFNGGEVMLGEITAVNIWDNVLHQYEILEISKHCLSKYKGNLKSWEDFKLGIRGEVQLVEGPTCCKVAA